MAKKPTIQAQSFRKGSAPGVPRITASIPDVTRVPSVGTFAAQSEADMLVSLADDSRRMQVLAEQNFALGSEIFNKAQAEVEQKQSLEAISKFSDISIGMQSEAQNIRISATDDTDIQAEINSMYDTTVQQTMERQDLSPFQKSQLESLFVKEKMSIAKDTAKFQMSLAQSDLEDNTQKTINGLGIEASLSPEKSFGKEDGSLRNKAREYAKTVLGVDSGPLYDSFIKSADKSIIVSGLNALAITEPEAALAQLKTMGESGELDDLMTGSEFNNLTKQFINQANTLNTKAEKIALGRSIAADPNKTVNPTSNEEKSAFNTYFEEEVLPALERVSPEEQQEVVVDIISSKLFIPKAIKGQVVNAVNSGDEAQVRRAADLYQAVVEEAPFMAKDLISGDEKDLLVTANRNLNLGIGLGKSVEAFKAKALLDSKGLLELRESRLTEIKKDINVDKEIGTFFGDTFLLTDVTPTGGASEFNTFDKAVMRYQAEFDLAYLKVDDIELAKQAAELSVRERFGVSKVNGREEVVEYPPERHFPIQGQDPSWIRTQAIERAETTIRDILQVDPDAPLDDNGVEAVKILSMMNPGLFGVGLNLVKDPLKAGTFIDVLSEFVFGPAGLSDELFDIKATTPEEEEQKKQDTKKEQLMNSIRLEATGHLDATNGKPTYIVKAKGFDGADIVLLPPDTNWQPDEDLARERLIALDEERDKRKVSDLLSFGSQGLGSSESVGVVDVIDEALNRSGLGVIRSVEDKMKKKKKEKDERDIS